MITVMMMKTKTKTVLGLLLFRSDSVVESLFPCILEWFKMNCKKDLLDGLI